MAVAVVMPKVGISVESCIVGSWKKKIGEPVSVGDILFDYETDKAVFECESTAEGILLEIFIKEGDEVPVLSPVCAVGQTGEDVSFLRPGGAVVSQSIQNAPQEPQPRETISSKEVRGSPRAKGLAERLGLNLSEAVPTGPAGRILARDVEALDVARRTPGIDRPLQPTTSKSDEALGYTDEKLSHIRIAIAKNMNASLQGAAQVTHHHSFDATNLLAMRKKFKADGEEMGLEGVSIGDMILYAAAYTLKAHLGLNAHLLDGNTLRLFKFVHMGVAVDTPRGLMVPTIFNADKKSLGDISKEVKILAAAAKSGDISPDLLRGASFTVTNLGAVGVEIFTPILNPPQVGILGICSSTSRARQGENGIELYPAMGLSLTYDHRAVDGAPASRFVQDLCKNLESFPLLLTT